MTKYKIGDIFEVISDERHPFINASVIQIIAVYTSTKRDKKIIYYRLIALFEEEGDPFRWKLTLDVLKNNEISVNRFKFGELLAGNKIRKLTAEKAAKILLMGLN